MKYLRNKIINAIGILLIIVLAFDAADGFVGTRRVLLASSIAINGLICPSCTPGDGVIINSSGTGLQDAGGFGNALLLPNTLSNMAKIRAGTGNIRALCLGESSTRGTGAGTGGSGTINEMAGSYCSWLATELNAFGIPAHQDSFLGYSLGASGTDSRVTLGSGWAIAASTSIGGTFLENSTNSNTLSFAPLNTVDTFRIWYITAGATNGTFTANIDGGATLATVNTNTGVGSVTSVTIGGSGSSILPGLHTVNVQQSAGAKIDIVGFESYNATVSSVSFINAGWFGATAANLAAAASGFAPLAGYTAVAPNITLLMEMDNDVVNTTPIASYITSMQTLITTGKVSGDVILVIPYWISSAASLQAPYQAALRTLANTNNVPLLDFTQRYTSFTTQSTQGFMFDGNHMLSTGYSDLAQGFARFLGTIMQGVGSTGGVAITPQGQSVLTTASYIGNGAPPTLTGTCTTGSQVGGSTVGSFTATCVAQTVIIALPPSTNGWACNARDITTPADTLLQISSTKTSATLSGTTVASDTILFNCVGY